MKNCTLKPYAGAKGVILLNGTNPGDHDFGYRCCLPRKFTIDGLVIDDAAIKDKGYKAPAVFGTFGRKADAEGLIEYPAAGEVSLKGITVTSGKQLRLSFNPALFKDYKVEGL